jgi:hypothetical protein
MTDFALPGSIEPAVTRPNLDKGFNPLTMIPAEPPWALRAPRFLLRTTAPDASHERSAIVGWCHP